MKRAHLLFPLLILVACTTKSLEEWTFEDSFPVVVDKNNKKYWDYLGGSVDTLQSGENFHAKFHMPRKSFGDSLGNEISNHLEKFEFDVKEDSVYLSFRKYTSISDDTAFVVIPVDTLVSKFRAERLIWRASLTTSVDTTFIINGDWYLHR